MRVECSWVLPGCKGQQEDKSPYDDTRTTHSLCETCAVQVHSELTAQLEEVSR